MKSCRWQYAASTLSMVAPDGTLVLYHVHAYARRWKGPGRDFAELNHTEHPNAAAIHDRVMAVAQQMNGLPVGDQTVPMAWDDPIGADNFLDESDDPTTLKFWEPDDDDAFEYRCG